MTMFTHHLPLAVFSFSEAALASKVIIISHYSGIYVLIFFSRKQNRDTHVCSLKTVSEHVAVKCGMDGTPLLVLVN